MRAQAFALAARRFILGVAVEQLLEGPQRLIVVARRLMGLAEVRERVRQAERITGAPIELDEPLERLDAPRAFVRPSA